MNLAPELKNHRILIIDDNPSIHVDIRKILAGPEENSNALAGTKALLFGEEFVPSAQTGFEIESAFQGQEGLEKVEAAEAAGRPFALAFVDVRMPPGWDGVETISRIWDRDPRLQAVICTAYSDYSWERMVQRLGKSDSLVILKKPFDNIEVLQLAHALTEKWHLSQELRGRLQNLDQLASRQAAEVQLANEQLREVGQRRLPEPAARSGEGRLFKAFNASPVPMAVQSLPRGEYTEANPGFLELTGYSRDELLGRTPGELNLWDDPSADTTLRRTLQGQNSIRNWACRWRSKSRELRAVRLSFARFDFEGEPFQLSLAQEVTPPLGGEHPLRPASAG